MVKVGPVEKSIFKRSTSGIHVLAGMMEKIYCIRNHDVKLVKYEDGIVMRIVAIMGSSKNGNTTETVKYFEKKITEYLNCEFEYLYLNDYPINFCTGCHNCIFIGQDKCPHYQSVKLIEDKMLESDGVILATPGYMFSVTGIMKNLLDHIAYNCHRPKYFGKKAFLISSCTKWQVKSVFTPMETWASGAGFASVGKMYVDMLPFPVNEKEMNKKREKIAKAAREFSIELKKEKVIKPDFGGIMIFHVFRTLCRIAPGILKADYEYFNNKNAYDNKTNWYVPAKVSFIYQKVAEFMTKRIEISVGKIIDSDKLKNDGTVFKNRLC